MRRTIGGLDTEFQGFRGVLTREDGLLHGRWRGLYFHELWSLPFTVAVELDDFGWQWQWKDVLRVQDGGAGGDSRWHGRRHHGGVATAWSVGQQGGRHR